MANMLGGKKKKRFAHFAGSRLSPSNLYLILVLKRYDDSTLMHIFIVPTISYRVVVILDIYKFTKDRSPERYAQTNDSITAGPNNWPSNLDLSSALYRHVGIVQVPIHRSIAVLQRSLHMYQVQEVFAYP